MFQGIFVPHVTPFDSEEKVNEEVLRSLVHYFEEAGLDGLVTLGSNGEFPCLSFEEKVRVLEIVRDEASLPVIAGATENSTREVVRISRVAMDLGVDAVLVAPPFYFKPSRDEIRAHYSAIAEKVEIPIFLYNVPKFTLVNIDVGIIETLVEEHSGIVGIKDSGGSVGQISEIIRKFGNHLDVFAGTADLLFPSLMLGAKGGIVAVANVAPRLCAQMYSAFLNKDYERAKKLHFLVNKLNEVLVKKYNQISAIKEAMGILGIEAGRARMPTLPLADAAVDEIRQVLEETGVKGQI